MESLYQSLLLTLCSCFEKERSLCFYFIFALQSGQKNGRYVMIANSTYDLCHLLIACVGNYVARNYEEQRVSVCRK